MINVAILGSTGSIGQQTLSVIRRYPDRFRVRALVCGTNSELLLSQAEEFRPDFVGIANESHAKALRGLSYGAQIEVGRDAQTIAASLPFVDVVVAAIVGLDGLRGVIAAIESGKNVALANKETLVACGQCVMSLARKRGVSILPIDSEHCAVWQCLQSGEKKEVSRIILTASGGPFRGKDKEFLRGVTPEMAIKHPNWNMGRKISVDSATMMNKGLELIEARWLFDCENVDYIIQPDSIIHSMVEYCDGAIIAQIASPTMEMPIQYALSYPERLPMDGAKFDFSKSIRFEKPNEDVFPLPKLARESLKIGGTAPAILNAANEAAVKLFLDKKIAFTDITTIVANILDRESPTSYDDWRDVGSVHMRVCELVARDYKKLTEI